jgi:hypothetical protein
MYAQVDLTGSFLLKGMESAASLVRDLSLEAAPKDSRKRQLMPVWQDFVMSKWIYGQI